MLREQALYDFNTFRPWNFCTLLYALVAQTVKHLPIMRVDPGSIHGLGRTSGEGNGNPFQYSCLENPMDGGAWQATVHRVVKSQTQLNDFTFFMLLDCSSVSQCIVYGNLNRISILLLCENCINLNCVELVHSAFQFYFIVLQLCIFILLIFEALILKLQLKIFISLKWNCNI